MNLYHITVEDATGEESVEVAVRADSAEQADSLAFSWASDKFDWIDFQSTVCHGVVETVPSGATAI